ncbi:hypothetical protein CROQUDRAFT_42444 [Cronartium quercuum f. sp. fusiforme G11]|uniref:Uncharacterized protein n=1 Tax=Cronartium quercuum f. sp. fusiforme G11 TaxID=708437 RepID=A0A9P6NLE1_9BASI|nr:hypothetical protein CROQUDRAFT_42444 [Cronartium quercuum f. sp. fusiforme G11]
MDNITPTDQPESVMGLVLCTCFKCIKVTCTDALGQTTKGLWVHPGTCRKHRTRMAAVSDDTSILKALAEDFHAKANIKDVDPVDACSDNDDMDSSLGPSMIQFVCKINFQFNLL